MMHLGHEGLKLVLVQDFTFHQPGGFSYLSVNMLVAYQRRNVLGAPSCAVGILQVVPPGM
jgi:hypothetical protein